MVLLALLDLSAAFDIIDHGILLKRLQDEVVISDLAYQWFQSYLADSCQFVRVNMASSDNTHLTCGVSQRLVLGPILFFSLGKILLQLGKLVDKYKLGRKLFAVDSGLYVSFQPNHAAADVGVQIWRSAVES